MILEQGVLSKKSAKADPGLRNEIGMLIKGIESGLTGMLFELNPESFTRSSTEKQDAVLVSFFTILSYFLINCYWYYMDTI